MNDLLKKLNTLVKASLNDLSPALPKPDRKAPDLDRQVDDLRTRINAALEHEDRLQAMANDLRAEVNRLDREADAAVSQGQDALARHILQQMERAQQRLTIAEAELRAHQQAAFELIQRVNLLEATIADNKAASQPPAPAAQADPAPDARLERIAGMLSQAQERARERIDTMNDMMQQRQTTAPDSAAASPPVTPSPPTADIPADDEMARRLSRLSKPKS